MTASGYAPKGFETFAVSRTTTEDEQIALMRDAEFLMHVGVGVSEAVLRAAIRTPFGMVITPPKPLLAGANYPS